MLCLQYAGAKSFITAQTDKVSADAGEIFTISVNAEVEQITGIQFEIEYNAQTAEYQSAEVSSTFDNALAKGIEAVSHGKVKVLAAFTDGENISGEICNVTFKALGGECDVQIKNIKLMINGDKMIENDISLNINKSETASDENGSSNDGSQSNGSSGGGSSNGISSGSSSGSHSSGGSHKNNIVIKDNSSVENSADNTEKHESTDTHASFADIDGHWAKDAITAMLHAGIVNGVGDNKFAPDAAVKRSELACMIANALDLTDIAENVYTDIESGMWYENGVLKCTKAGIMLGNDGNFRPNDYVTREETAAVTARAAEYLKLNLDVTDNDISFTDFDDVSTWTRDSVKKMASDGILSGFEDGSFRPAEETTRAHAAVILNKLLNLKKDFEG